MILAITVDRHRPNQKTLLDHKHISREKNIYTYILIFAYFLTKCVIVCSKGVSVILKLIRCPPKNGTIENMYCNYCYEYDYSIFINT